MPGMPARETAAETDEMALIAGGRFHTGSDRFYPEEAPVRAAEVGSFLIDIDIGLRSVAAAPHG